MAAQHVLEVFSEALASWQVLQLAGARGTSPMGDLLLLLGEAQERHSQETRSTKSRTQMFRRARRQQNGVIASRGNAPEVFDVSHV